MCGRCWSAVPTSLQREVNRTWRAADKTFIDAPEWRDYYKARNAAIEAVKGNQQNLEFAR